MKRTAIGVLLPLIKNEATYAKTKDGDERGQPDHHGKYIAGNVPVK